MEFLYSYALVALALLYSYYKNLDIEKTLAINSIVAFIQLMLLGVALKFLLEANSILEIALIAFVMLLYGSHIANKRTELKDGGYLRGFLVLFLCTSSIIAFLLVTKVIKTDANQLVPLYGMALGNALNVYAQLIERVKSDIRLSICDIEGRVALGASIQEALSDSFKKGAKAALMPTLNQLQTVGIIQIPGVTVGMIMAGANPIDAVSFQLVIMFMMVAISVFVAAFTKAICGNVIFKSI